MFRFLLKLEDVAAISLHFRRKLSFYYQSWKWYLFLKIGNRLNTFFTLNFNLFINKEIKTVQVWLSHRDINIFCLDIEPHTSNRWKSVFTSINTIKINHNLNMLLIEKQLHTWIFLVDRFWLSNSTQSVSLRQSVCSEFI